MVQKPDVGSESVFAFCSPGECNVHSPRSTSGATLANLFVAGTQLGPKSPHTVAEVRLLGFELVLSEVIFVSHDALPTELNRDRLVLTGFDLSVFSNHPSSN